MQNRTWPEAKSLRSKVHIVDDDPQVRGSTSFLLRSLGYETEIYSDGVEFLADAKFGDGCILLDLRMPRLNGLQVQAELARRGISMPLVMLSGHGDIATAVEAMKLGALDFVEKPYQEERLLSVIRAALESAAQARHRQEIRRLALQQVKLLSPREAQVLRGLLGGLPNKAIARRLDLSPRTVEMYRAKMTEKLGVVSSSQAVAVALKAGLEPLEDPDGP